MIVIARRQLRGSYGLVATGDRFNVAPDLAKDLLNRQLVSLPEVYEKKVVTPPETKSSRTRKTKSTESQDAQ